jgi:transposase-like protein
MEETQSSISSGPRKYLTAKEKFSIVKEQLTTKTGVTEICKKYGIAASQFYRWQELFFEGAALGLETSKRGQASAGELAIAQKQSEEQRREIARLKEVVLEIAAENVVLKKSPGVLSTIR